MSTWGNLSSGLIGGTLGGVLSFAAAAWTIVATRRGDQRREAQRVAERDADRREALVATFVGTLRALETEVRWAPLMTGRTGARLIEAAINFYASQRQDHPQVATWVMAQLAYIQEALTTWHRWWWVPLIHRHHLGRVGKRLGELAGAITLWTTGDIPDIAFANASDTPESIVAVARAQEEAAS